MKNFAIAVAMCLAACGTDFNPCPKPTASPCPTIEPCPLPTPCPDCPMPTPCPIATPCPTPTPPPEFPNVSHSISEFDVIAVLATKDTLGLYVSDPNGVYDASVFPMPELLQKIEFEEILSLDVSQGDTQPDSELTDTTVDIGTTEGEVDKYGLVVSELCGREFSNACTATVVSNGNQLTVLKIDLLATQQSFDWKNK